ncbi:hypothetical protein GCM10010096_11770 [Alcaligenes pakistanensis]|uniref:Flagellar protein FlhE n=1 Tax=Alcaligenes pakistanensis TaxID=1482717 RepID=A0A8H9IGK4_9BURK|nr:hypothetical protein GCM10010096_11770 [Alcaligenes pakistanensis]
MKIRFSIASITFIIIQFFSLTSPAYAAASFWTGLQTIKLTSLGMHQFSYNPIQLGHTIPAGAKIHRIEAHMEGDQIDRIASQTYVCWNGTTQCVQMYGKHLTTRFFNDFDASKPIYVVVRVDNFGGLYPPAFSPTSVTVYYTY